ncbi:MAG TPA: 50S ribosomal protein L6 [Saprospiraceae bacterium]|nr:50S ribosomal protein L6 [Saprospiraceae bacterium]HQW54691.1 50S ribosomal protein L6 [Saprospiraceae bacterium]
MSRIGKASITLPKGVEVNIEKANKVTVKGPKGTLTKRFDPDLTISVEDGILSIGRPTDQQRHRAMHGLSRALINGMVEGVAEGFTKQMELIGVGYRASNQGQVLELAVGFSHPIIFALPEEIKLETKTEKGIPPTIILTGIDKQLIGQVAAKIRAFKKPEPYKGKGIRFKGEVVRRKAGKAAAKK